MADIKPVRRYLTGLAEFQSGDTIGIADGGSGAGTASGARTNFDVYSKGEVDGLISGVGSGSIGDKVTGHIDPSESVLTWDAGTRTMTIAPATTEFSYYIQDQKITRTTPSSYQWPDVTGGYIVVLDAQGNLAPPAYTPSYVRNLLYDNAITMYVYWNATAQKIIVKGDERHGHTMSPRTHQYLHSTRGTSYAGGLNLYNVIVDDDGDDNEQVQFGITAGSIWDEDIQHNIPEKLPTDNIKIIYREGTDGRWNSIENHPYICYNGSLPSGSRANYNRLNGSNWEFDQVSNNDFMLMHLFATNDLESPLILVMGQEEYTTGFNAREAVQDELLQLQTDGLPTSEFKSIASFIIQTSTNYNNAVHSRIRSTSDGDDYYDWRYERTGGD